MTQNGCMKKTFVPFFKFFFLSLLLFGFNNLKSQVINEGFEENEWTTGTGSTSGGISLSSTSASSTMTYYNCSAASSSSFSTSGAYTLTVPFYSSSSATNSSTRTSYTVHFTSSGINTSPNSGLWWYSKATTSSDTRLQKAHSATKSLQIGSGGYIITPVISKGIASVTFWAAPASAVAIGVNTNTNAAQPTYVSSESSAIGGFTHFSQTYPQNGTDGNTYIQSFNATFTVSGAAKIGIFNAGSSSIYLDDIVINTFAAGTLPTIVLNSATATGQTTGSAAATITANNPTPNSTLFQSSIIWSTSNTPLDTSLATKTTNGPGGAGVYSGTMNANITALTAGTTYFVRAYSLTSGGIVYSNIISFTTNPPVVPSLTTTAVSSITALSAASGGTITSNGAATITAKGVCWATTANPTTANAKTTDGIGDASYSSLMGVLAPATTYHVRAYATNSVGTGYGNDITFTTPASSPTLVALPSSINFGNVVINTSSVQQSFTITGIALTGNITVTAPSGYTVSLTPGGTYSSSVSVTPTAGSLSQTVYVKFNPILYGNIAGNVAISGGGATTVNVAVTGVGVQSPTDVSNAGLDFWLGFGYQSNMDTKASSTDRAQLSVYIAAGDQDATVMVDIPNMQGVSVAPWNFPRTINIPANGVVEVKDYPVGDSSNVLNTTGRPDCRLYYTGISNRAIHVYSTNGVPVSAWMYTSTKNNSAAGSMLFPTNTWNNAYTVQSYGGITNNGDPNSFFFVIAAEDNTVIEFKPTNDIVDSLSTTLFKDNHTAAYVKYQKNQTYQITLNKGQVFNCMGYIQGTGSNSANGLDLSGTTVKAVDCNKKIAVYSGNGRVLVNTATGSVSTGSDNLIQQMFPKAAWGRKYLTVPTKTMEYNVFRIAVQDPTTLVWVNSPTVHTAATALPASQLNTTGLYYSIEGNQPNLIESDKPINVTQFVIAGTAPDGVEAPHSTIGNGGLGDPEMIILSPVEQSINKATVYSPNFKNGGTGGSYINVVMKKLGVSSFKLDNVAVADTGLSSYSTVGVPAIYASSGNTSIPMASIFKPHPGDTSYYYAKFFVASGAPHTLYSDYPFNAIAYGMDQGESYGYNAGTYLKDLDQSLYTQNPYAISTEGRACKDVPFKMRVTLPYVASELTSLVWNFNGISNILPSNATVTQSSPTPDSTFVVNGNTVYLYSITTPYTFTQTGTYAITVTANVASGGGCIGARTYNFNINVVDGVIVDFTTTNNYRTCLNDSTRFLDNSNGQGYNVIKWKWDFTNITPAQVDSVKNPVRFFGNVGAVTATLRAINSLGCYADVTKTINILALPKALFTANDPVCANSAMQFNSSTSTGGGGTINTWN